MFLSKIRSRFTHPSFFVSSSLSFSSTSSSSSDPSLLLGRKSSSLRMGIVGMANVGKSTTFNILTKQNVPAENFPFCTIDPNLALVSIPDKRFEKLVEMFKPKNKLPATLSIIDIAGLVKGASEGHGLGNEFLSHIQSVDGIYHVIRGFEYEKIIHTEGEMNPMRDVKIIINELMAKDLQFLEKRKEEVDKKAKNIKGNAELQETSAAIHKAYNNLKKKIPIKNVTWTANEAVILNRYMLLTAKPMLYLINLSKPDYLLHQEKKALKNNYIQEITKWVNENGKGVVIPYSAEYEKESDNNNFTSNIIQSGYKLLNLIHFFTVGSDEVRCWTIKNHTQAAQAAGCIHTDFEKYFVSAEVISYEEFLKEGVSRYEKKMRKEGKNYVVKDGDIITFRSKKKK